MNSKFINFLGVVLVFFGLFTLMFIHYNHHEEEVSVEQNGEESTKSLNKEQWTHILVGFQSSIIGAVLLILAERKTAKK